MKSQPETPLRKRLAWFAVLYTLGVAAVAVVAACFRLLIMAVSR